ncbi:MAG: exodeoxyribonuclease III [Gammaproteobacteria bacterium]|nr:exodeoxyribonuclease III [Gammaproteobacteria bacterium]
MKNQYLKIATWNVNSIRTRLEHVLTWLKDHDPDVFALQETKTPDDQFPAKEIEEAGFHVIYSGQKAYHGVAVICKKEPEAMIKEFPDFPDEQRRVLGFTIDDLRILNIYVPNGTSLDSPNYEYKLKWLESLRKFIQSELKIHQKLIVLGDFNIAPEDRDVYDPKIWRNRVLVSEPERAAFQKLLETGLFDAFRLFHSEGGFYSWWDYRTAGIWRNEGLRLDMILINETLKKRCTSCEIDKHPRKLKRPSDHAPVIATFSS